MSENTSNEEISIYLDIEEQRNKVFPNVDEFLEWANEQKALFDWVPNTNTFPTTNVLRQHLNSNYQTLVNNLTQAQRHKANPPNYEKFLKAATDHVERQIKSGKILFSEHQVFDFIKTLKDEDIGQAIYALGYYFRIPNMQFHHIDAFDGIYRIKKFLDGTSNDGFNVLNQRIEETLASYKNSLEVEEAEIKEYKQSFKALEKKVDDKLGDQTTDYEGIITTKKGELEVVVQEFKDQKDAVVKSFEEHMSLKTPVTYWKNKRFWSYLQAGLIGLLLSLFVYCAGIKLHEIGKSIYDLGPTDFHYGKVSFFLVFGLLFFGILKTLTQILMSRLHLASEAYEKSVMMETYLSLVQEEKVTEAERELALKNLFRSSSTGLIKDETGGSAFEIINKMINKGE